jgi:hypothetical protein
MRLYYRVQSAASGVSFRVVAGTIAIAPLYALGWLAGRIARTVWRSLVWLWTALRIGATDGWMGADGPA